MVGKHHSQDSELLCDQARGRCGFVAIIGRANVGKSTLLNALIGQKIAIVSSKSQTTRNRILGVKTKNNIQTIFLDTPGFAISAKKNALNSMLNQEVLRAASGVDVIMLVIDAVKAVNDGSHISRIHALIRNQRIGYPSLIALNKVDTVSRDDVLPLLGQLSDVFDKQVELVPISAKRKDGLETLEKTIAKMLPVAPMCFPEDTLTDQTERVMVAEVIREKLFSRLHNELPYSVAVEVETWKEIGGIVHIGAVIFVERKSQKGIVIGAGGLILKTIGQAARLELEKFFGIRINLRLFVRVEPNWTKTTSGLTRAGYG